MRRRRSRSKSKSMSPDGLRKPTRGTMLRTPMRGTHIIPGRVRHTKRRGVPKQTLGRKR